MSVTVQPRAIVAAEADVKGDVTIGSGTVVHPRARIHATSAPIVLGNNCIVEELATIESATVASNVHVSNFCVIGAGCVVESADNTLVHLDERSAIYGGYGSAHAWSGEGIGQKLAKHAKQLAFLSETIPQSHKLRITRR
ncbi:hypothetical protein MVES1_000002 [Malassezia vespertilionis]|uniref:uncharacterized protein n=1 Tax=Malassezia vespertilionis TaxID=2020962 RepID=UPI0024B05C39|nr:uncharacterized protein MVES1_000002 [Malassezia vespertilionis]WFD04679.1 hypothetical protein MVES1_000002 [Malassezia vespertilionis]